MLTDGTPPNASAASSGACSERRTVGNGRSGYPASVALAASAGKTMRFLLAPYYGLNHLIRELMKFGVVGSIAYVIDAGVNNLLRQTEALDDRPLTAKGISVAFAAVFAFLGNRFWTFQASVGPRACPWFRALPLPQLRRAPDRRGLPGAEPLCARDSRHFSPTTSRETSSEPASARCSGSGPTANGSSPRSAWRRPRRSPRDTYPRSRTHTSRRNPTLLPSRTLSQSPAGRVHGPGPGRSCPLIGRGPCRSRPRPSAVRPVYDGGQVEAVRLAGRLQARQSEAGFPGRPDRADWP